jgi:hypothetical protein
MLSSRRVPPGLAAILSRTRAPLGTIVARRHRRFPGRGEIDDGKEAFHGLRGSSARLPKGKCDMRVVIVDDDAAASHRLPDH